MKILSILNLSNKEKPGCDSGVIFHRLFFGELAKRKGIRCAVASPVALHIPRVRDVYSNPGSSKYDVRFRFDWDAQKSLIESERPDVLFVNQIELVNHYRALLVTLGLDTKIVTYAHYLPILKINKKRITWDPSLNHAGLAEIILWNLFAALKTADEVFVTSQFAKSMILTAAKRYRIAVPPSRIHILPCPADTFFLSKRKARFKDTKRILYNSRLYKQYGTDAFIALAKKMAHDDVTFVVADLLSKRNGQRKKLETSVDRYRHILQHLPNVRMRNDGDVRATYRRMVEDSDLILAPYRLNANWSMGAMDGMGIGIPAVCPNIATFPEFVPSELLYNTQAQAIALIRRLLTDRAFWQQCSEACRRKATAFAPRIMVNTFLKDMKYDKR